MRFRNVFSNLFTLLFCAAIPSLAADYNIVVKNETTRNSGSTIYVQVQTTRTGGIGGRTQTQNGRCTALTSYGDGSFYLKQAMEAEQNPKLNFYTSNTCRANTSVGSVSPLEGPEPAATDLIITITDAGVTVANSAEPITPPTTTPGGTETRPGGPGGGPGTTTPTTSNRKVIRFFAPWTNTSAILYVAGGDSAKMRRIFRQSVFGYLRI